MVTSSNAARARRAGCALAILTVFAACGGGAAEPLEEADSGFLRAAPTQEVLAAETPLAGEPEEAEAVTPPPAQPAVVPKEPSPAVTQPAKDLEWRGPAPDASDLELAAGLLQRPYSAFKPLLDRRTALPAARRSLLAAFSAATSGQGEVARSLASSLDGSPSVSTRERELLQRALDPAVGRPIEASLNLSTTPLERAMGMALLARGAREASSAGRSADAAMLWSQLLMAEMQSPWATAREALTSWSQALMQAQAKHRWNPRGDWPSFEVQVRPGDSLIAIRKRVLEQRPELLLCTGLIARANGLANENSIRPDDVLRIPTDRASALVDVSSRWAFYLLGEEIVAAWEIGVGKEEGTTRVGTYTVGDKQSEPMWFRPGHDPVPFGDPENPLGTRWMAWNDGGKPTSLGFHGTTDPSGVGGRVSLGCVRMHNEHVEALFEILPRGATVVVQP